MDVLAWLLAIFCCVVLLFIFEVEDKKAFLKNENVLKGIGITVLVAALFGGIAQCARATEIETFSYIEMSVGLDYTKGQSPQCLKVGNSDRWTSNINFTGNILKYGAFELNGRGTHHSCAINEDRNGYDAIGPELRLRVEF